MELSYEAFWLIVLTIVAAVFLILMSVYYWQIVLGDDDEIPLGQCYIHHYEPACDKLHENDLQNATDQFYAMTEDNQSKLCDILDNKIPWCFKEVPFP